ncbi:MAG: hypothetical protein ACI8RD_009569 [Bacillariaceae sp.]|jgi:hypothetical protein
MSDKVTGRVTNLLMTKYFLNFIHLSGTQYGFSRGYIF